jgi:hypothetical protein
MNSDFSDLLRIINARSVNYLVVGGYAVMHYAEPRFTKDLDLWVEPSPGNGERVFTALAEFGAPLQGLSPADFAREGFCYQVGRPPVRVDILMSVDGLEFGAAWENRVPARLGAADVWMISREDLIRNKRATGRHIDLHDAELLEQTRPPG